MVDHIDLSGTHHHDHNTDGIGSYYCLDKTTMGWDLSEEVLCEQ